VAHVQKYNSRGVLENELIRKVQPLRFQVILLQQPCYSVSHSNTLQKKYILIVTLTAIAIV
jgi:hypothetical protein